MIYRNIDFTPITEVSIRDKVEPLFRDKYVVCVEFMFGDADGFEELFVPFEWRQEELMIEFLQFLQRCSAAYPNGKRGYDDYCHVDGYDKWVDTEIGLEYWPLQDCEYPASFERAQVYYYDIYGYNYHVEAK